MDWEMAQTDRIFSRLAEIVKLEPYDFKQTLQILSYRSDIAFKKNIIDDKIIVNITTIAIEYRNMAEGMKILRKCGIFMEKECIEHNVSYETNDQPQCPLCWLQNFHHRSCDAARIFVQKDDEIMAQSILNQLNGVVKRHG